MIKKYNILFFMILVLLFASIPEAHADVFDRLKDLGNAMGTGLAKFGYMVAGLGLLAFSVAAIFNKVSWKTLAYIMMSTFIITLLLKGYIHDYLRVGGDTGVVTNGIGGSATPAGDAQSNNMPKGGK